jgi:hypothetical protein
MVSWSSLHFLKKGSSLQGWALPPRAAATRDGKKKETRLSQQAFLTALPIEACLTSDRWHQWIVKSPGAALSQLGRLAAFNRESQILFR